VLVGRDEELGRLDVLLDEARRGRSGTLVVAGEAGVGKTALLEEARRLAADMDTVTATGLETESELPFAHLHDLLRPLLGLLPQIPQHQADALAAALALAPGEPDSLAVGAATLSLLVEAAERRPLLVLVDDAHWFDRASADALVFAARRLRLEQIAVLAAVRAAAASAFDTFARLELSPLSTEDSRRVLRQRTQPIPAADEPRLLAAAAGNPLALLELPVELAQDLPTASTSHERLQRAFGRRVDVLPADARLGLLLAAAEPDLAAVKRAAALQELADPLGPAEAAGLIRLGNGSLAFRHPVIRSLVYANASSDARATAHRLLAAALPDEADRDRRAWHLAAAADGPEEEVATLLEQTADRAMARGGHSAAARALERAARLSPDPEREARRLYAASRSAYWAGDSANAVSLADDALTITGDPLLRADLLQQLDAVGEWSGASLPDSVFLSALEADGLDEERRARLFYVVVKHRLDAFDAAGAMALAPQLEQHAREAGPWWSPRTLAGAAGAYLLAGERDTAVSLFRELAAHPAMPAGFAFDYMALEWYDEVRSSLADTFREGRASANQLRIVWNQMVSAHLEVRLGRLGAAEIAASEAISLGEVLGVTTLVGAAAAAVAAVNAWRGDAGACSANAQRAIVEAQASGDRYQQGLAHGALAHLALGSGNPREAVAQLEPLARFWAQTEVADPAAVPFVPDLVEAYVLTRDLDRARSLLNGYAVLAESAGTVWARGVCARCEGSLAEPDDVDTAFAASNELFETSPYALERARTRLAYGERLRRLGRRRDARVQLQAAIDVFEAAGASLWQERALAELRSTGAKVGAPERRQVDLTAQELHIATLVAEGKTNKEIAAAMYLSPKTVEYHLANTFRKLDIHSRAELARITARRGGSVN